jgi:hypothetical protein
MMLVEYLVIRQISKGNGQDFQIAMMLKGHKNILSSGAKSMICRRPSAGMFFGYSSHILATKCTLRGRDRYANNFERLLGINSLGRRH